MKSSITKNNSSVKFRSFAEQEQMGYLYFSPKKVKSVLVLVHGISRNAEQIIKTFMPLAQEQNVLLIAPVFNKNYAKDYQRLGRKNKGPRSDYQLLAMLNDCKSHLNMAFKKINIFGFSAGAQFAHRFAFAYPNLVHKVALVSAGWYTLPMKHLRYPIGIKLHKEFSNINFEPARFLRLKYKVFIGSYDTKRDHSLNKNKKIDETQGLNRFERASNWVELMQLEFQKYGIKNRIDLEILEDADHDFSHCNSKAQLTEKVMQWMKDE